MDGNPYNKDFSSLYHLVYVRKMPLPSQLYIPMVQHSLWSYPRALFVIFFLESLNFIVWIMLACILLHISTFKIKRNKLICLLLQPERFWTNLQPAQFVSFLKLPSQQSPASWQQYTWVVCLFVGVQISICISYPIYSLGTAAWWSSKSWTDENAAKVWRDQEPGIHLTAEKSPANGNSL